MAFCNWSLNGTDRAGAEDRTLALLARNGNAVAILPLANFAAG